MASMGVMRRRHRQSWWWRPLSFRKVVLLVLIACIFLAFAPVLFLRLLSKERLSRKCSWLGNRPLVCAHGGDTRNTPPNTLEAFDEALKLDVDCIEIDVSSSQDGELVALHDRDLQNLYGNDYIRVGDLTFNEIVRLDAGQNFANKFHNQIMVPTLLKSLQHVSNRVKRIIVDAKIGHPAYVATLARRILDAVNYTDCRNCIIWSKEDNLVRELKKLAPHVPVGFIVLKEGTMNSPTRIKAAEVVGAYYGAVDAGFVKKIHESRKLVFVWTVDDGEKMKDMLFDGVDGIITSQSQLLLGTMNQIERECSDEGFYWHLQGRFFVVYQASNSSF
ncbi:hypothetical protein KP509_28G070000 [Ceratopteris richardii]|uniref:glycerophosphodiester phosphodiesterase n=1 Tax=Ceratopteris richardii TaxID=49495 RepID=A0A8T2RF84_CERRI|nr:hypothetical protein KP509_28G070000 [Ceratopteris richardii]KAH7294408.1 hypothetical protein KP509_28G070000 [Ceratopteris richardii]